MKRILLSILLAMVLLIFALSVIGCHSLSEIELGGALIVQRTVDTIIGGQGLGETEAERIDDHSRQLRLNNSMMIDDGDAWWQRDRQSRLTEYTVR